MAVWFRALSSQFWYTCMNGDMANPPRWPFEMHVQLHMSMFISWRVIFWRRKKLLQLRHFQVYLLQCITFIFIHSMFAKFSLICKKSRQLLENLAWILSKKCMVSHDVPSQMCWIPRKDLMTYHPRCLEFQEKISWRTIPDVLNSKKRSHDITSQMCSSPKNVITPPHPPPPPTNTTPKKTTKKEVSLRRNTIKKEKMRSRCGASAVNMQKHCFVTRPSARAQPTTRSQSRSNHLSDSLLFTRPTGFVLCIFATSWSTGLSYKAFDKVGRYWEVESTTSFPDTQRYHTCWLG